MKTTLDSFGFAVGDGYIRIYNIDPLTSEFVSEGDEYLTVGVGLPANSCIDEPPAVKSGFAIIRVNEAWSYTEDHRNTTVYSVETGQEVTVTELGPLKDDVTIYRPQTPFDKWNGESWVMDEQAKKQADITAAELEKQHLIDEANTHISIEQWPSKLALGRLNDAGKVKFNLWLDYLDALNAIDTSLVPNIEWSQKPD